MGNLLSKIYSFLSKDDAVPLDATYQPNADDRRLIDNQIQGVQQHLIDSLIQSKHATWFSVTGPTLVAGDVVCSASLGMDADGFAIVTKALPSPLGAAKSICGVVVRGTVTGSKVLVANAGILPPSITGLPTGNTDQGVRVSSLGRCENVASLGASDYPVGVLTTDGYLTLTSPISPGLLVLSGGGGAGGITYTLDGASPALVSGDWVCVVAANANSLVITKALPTPLAIAGVALGMVIAPWAPGAIGVVVAIGGTSSAAQSGLAAGVAGEVYIDATARSTRSQASGFRGGYCDTTGKVTILPKALPLAEVNVLHSPWNFDNTGVTANDAKLTALLTFIGATARMRLYFPAGDYRWNGTIGPFPAGTIISGDGIAGGLTPDDAAYATASAGRLNQICGTRFLFYGTGVGVQLGHPYLAAAGSNGGGGQTFEHIIVLGRVQTGALPQCIVGATNTSPITITTRSAHGYTTGDQIINRGVQGNTAANSHHFQPWTITVTGPTTFTLDSADTGPSADGLHHTFVSDGTGSGVFSATTLTVSGAANTSGGTRSIGITTTADHNLPVGARVFVSGITGNTNANGEFQVVPFPVDPRVFRIENSGNPSGVATTSGPSPYSGGPGTVVYGGHCLRINGINDVGIEILADSHVTVRQCKIGGFKYFMSFDGAEVCFADRMSFNGVNWDAGFFGYMDQDTELGPDSCFAARIGEWKFAISGSTNGIWITGYDLNASHCGFLHFGGEGHYISGGNSELTGAMTVFLGGQGILYDQNLSEGGEIATFLALGTDLPGGAFDIAIRDFTPSGAGPFIWCYASNTLGQITLSNCDFSQMTGAFAPITGAANCGHIRNLDCPLPVTGTFKQALTDVEAGEDSTYVGIGIGSTTAIQGAVDVRVVKQDGTPSAIFRNGPRTFKYLGSSTGYPGGGSGLNATDKNTLLRNYSVNTGLIASQQVDVAAWVYIDPASVFAPADYVNVPVDAAAFDGVIEITMYVVALRQDTINAARWRISQLCKFESHTTLTLLGVPNVEIAEDLDGGFTAPTITIDNSGSPKINAHLSPYSGHATDWGVFFTLRYVGH